MVNVDSGEMRKDTRLVVSCFGRANESDKSILVRVEHCVMERLLVGMMIDEATSNYVNASFIREKNAKLPEIKAIR